MAEPNDANGNEEMDEAFREIIEGINRHYCQVTITGVNGTCPYGHQEGDTFKVTTMNCGGLCGSLYQAIFSQVEVLVYRGSVLWEPRADSFTAICPENSIVSVQARRRERSELLTVLKTPEAMQEMTGKGFAGLDKYRLYLEVIGIEQDCAYGHREGERIEIDLFNTNGICGSLYQVAYPFVNLLLTGGKAPWQSEPNIALGVCPDPYNLLSFRLIREER